MDIMQNIGNLDMYLLPFYHRCKLNKISNLIIHSWVSSSYHVISEKHTPTLYRYKHKNVHCSLIYSKCRLIQCTSHAVHITTIVNTVCGTSL